MWWLHRGRARLEMERGMLTKLHNYWQGIIPFPEPIDQETAEKWRQLIEECQINYMRTVVEVTSERLRVQGLWIPGDNERADSETWALWESNDLEAWQTVAFSEMIAKRRAYWSVWFDADDPTKPRIEVEDALQTWVELVPGSRTRRAAGVKVFLDDWTGEEHADVLRPEGLHYYRRAAAGWKERQPSAANPLGVVPIVPMVNAPTLSSAEVGHSEIEDLLATNDRIIRTVLGRTLAGHTAAFAQKWATGIEIPEDDDGNPIAPFKPGVTELWTSEDPEAQFGQFSASDPAYYVKSEEQDIQHIANVSRMPRHYFNPTGQAPSGDAMDSAEAGLDAKVSKMQTFCAAPIKEVLRLARKIAKLDTPLESEIVWADTGYKSFAQLVDGEIKLLQANVTSKPYARERVGMSPATMRRVEREILADQIMGDALDPTPVEP
jgi:hypothetical protein